MAKIRLYISQPLNVNTLIILEEGQSHYLRDVMKLRVGDNVSCFDGQSGEYGCTLEKIDKKHCEIKVNSHDKPYKAVPDIWLLFAPVKKDNTDFIIQKATELGVRKIIPVITAHTISDRVKKERFIAGAIEAAEQCRRTDVPDIGETLRFNDLLSNWDSQRTLYFMDETLNGNSVKEVFAGASEPCAILVGPEGGFSAQELEKLRSCSFAKGVTLGNRILRAETAVAAALSCWQALSGDW